MPHYRDGTEAQVGDIVRDCSDYHGPARIVGEVMSISPGSTACNANVAFIEDVASPRSVICGNIVASRSYHQTGPGNPTLRGFAVSTITLADMELVYRKAAAEPVEQGVANAA